MASCSDELPDSEASTTVREDGPSSQPAKFDECMEMHVAQVVSHSRDLSLLCVLDVVFMWFGLGFFGIYSKAFDSILSTASASSHLLLSPMCSSG